MNSGHRSHGNLRDRQRQLHDERRARSPPGDLRGHGAAVLLDDMFAEEIFSLRLGDFSASSVAAGLNLKTATSQIAGG